MTSAPVHLNPLELSGARLPGFVHAVANHLAKLAGEVEILRAGSDGYPAECRDSLANIRRNAEGMRDQIDALCAVRQESLQDVPGTLPLVPVGELADVLAETLSTRGWEIQRSRALDAPYLTRAKVRWLRYVLETLAPAGAGRPGGAVFQLHRDSPRTEPTQFSIRLLYDEVPAICAATAGQETLDTCRQVLAAMGGALLSQGFPEAVLHLTIALPIIVPTTL